MAQEPVRLLRGVVFQTVEEPTVGDVRLRVYANLRTVVSTQILIRRSGEEAERREFDRAHNDTRLGRCVRTMAKEYVEM